MVAGEPGALEPLAVLQLELAGDAAIAGQLRRVVGAHEIHAADAELLGGEQRVEGVLAGQGQQHRPIAAQRLHALGVADQLGEIAAAVDARQVGRTAAARRQNVEPVAELQVEYVDAVVRIDEVVEAANLNRTDAVVQQGRGAAKEVGVQVGRN